MNQEQVQNQKKGLISGLIAYILWGVLPLYWKSVGEVSALSILCYRIFWSFIFMVVILIISGKTKAFIAETKTLLQDHKRVIAIILAALLVSANWFIFIFSIGSGHVVEASLGYYINPLVNVVLATVFLKERLGRAEFIA
ncbi:MAG: EamA family transporter, partial [Carnobacterium sp.]